MKKIWDGENSLEDINAIDAAADILKIDFYELLSALNGPADNKLSRSEWVEAATNIILSFPIEYNAEKIASALYDRMICLHGEDSR